MAQRHLTDEKVLPSSWKAIRRTILYVLLVMVAINVASVYCFDKNSFNETYWIFQWKWRKLLDGPKLDWLIFGDSSGNQCLDAGLFAQSMGPSFNFCTFADALVRNDKDMLEAYIARHGAPKGVLLVHNHNIWYRTANPQVIAHGPIPFSKLSEYSEGVPDKGKFALTYALDRWVPLYAQHLSYWGFLTQPQKLFSKRTPVDEFGFEHHPNADTAHVTRHYNFHVDFASKNKFAVSKINLDAIDAMCKMAEKYNFDIYYAQSPMYDKAYANPVIREYYDQLMAFLQGLEAKYPRLHLLGPFPITEPAERMQSVDHATYATAEDYTQTIIGRIQALQQSGKNDAN
jgi:hypothetical protein